jgi:hypothetical protein
MSWLRRAFSIHDSRFTIHYLRRPDREPGGKALPDPCRDRDQ